ncbi:hypothetical protein [Oceanobacillus sp. FSL H7-0719]|uniref:hypothetical protein n=1 Tax=Oceanobacillus sp. FSL H7-0719 TaxID=2954507 RepID=UPI0032495618
MELKSSYNQQFKIDKHDVIMWNEHIYQLLSQLENDGSYPVLRENEVRKYINSGELRFVKHHISEYTGVPCTYYKLS